MSLGKGDSDHQYLHKRESGYLLSFAGVDMSYRGHKGFSFWLLSLVWI